ncbi:SRPBCC domain-containing protein [Prauserella flavalba]|uniref:Activator of Hsp90 ATPase homologue 1/2-like C-terminal domain-containing protein n=1 Tax=Prauserella flavalba TaxID=1477506 RepID=A0A318LHV5_9PSEU|nr:SRPBCC domain-containing protein [Prauserella flavalba]PXY28530.1 hypothetical protein BA062_21910 [Prauserella flavalba]
MNDVARRVGDRWELRFERRLRHPPAKVWRALTEPEHLSRWYPLTATELDLRVGGAIRFRDEEGTEVRAVITDLAEQSVFAFDEFDAETGTHHARFDLEPDGTGCLLIFRHRFADDEWAGQMHQGWLGCLDALGTALGELDPLGSMDVVAGKPVLRFRRRLAHAPEKVWRAVTDPAESAHWFPAAIETEPSIGAAMRFRFGEERHDLGGPFAEGEVLEYDPPKVYAFRWADSVLRFELVPDDSGCLLLFSHTLSGTGTTGDLPSVARQAPGWDACLDLLGARLDGRPAPAPEFLARAERYVEEFGLGRGEVRRSGEGYELRFERDLVQPPAEVWRTLAEGDEPRVDGPVPVVFAHGYAETGEVTAVEEGRVVEYAWLHDGVPAGRVRFELREQEPVGTRLVLTQTVPSRLAGLRATALAAWQTHLELFFAALHGDVRCPWPAERTERLRRDYTTELDLGTVHETGDGRCALRFERHVRHAPEKVWAAITEPEHLRSWFPAVVEFDLRPGARLRFGVTAEQVRRYGMDPGHVTEGEVLRADPPRLLEFTWGEETLRWELSPDGDGGCHVVFTNVVGDRDTLAPAGAGWHAGLEVMVAQLDGREVGWSPFDRAEQLASAYA